MKLHIGWVALLIIGLLAWYVVKHGGISAAAGG